MERGRHRTNWSKPTSNIQLSLSEREGLGIPGVVESPEMNYEMGGYTGSSSEEDFGGQEMRRPLLEESKLYKTPPPLIRSGLKSKYKPNSTRQVLPSSFSSSSSMELSDSSPTTSKS